MAINSPLYYGSIHCFQKETVQTFLHKRDKFNAVYEPFGHVYKLMFRHKRKMYQALYYKYMIYETHFYSIISINYLIVTFIYMLSVSKLANLENRGKQLKVVV